MVNSNIYCFKKKSEINARLLLNTYSFSTLKFNSLSDLIIASSNLEQRLKSSIALLLSLDWYWFALYIAAFFVVRDVFFGSGYFSDYFSILVYRVMC